MTRGDRELLAEILAAIEAVARSPVHPVPGGGVMLRLTSDTLVDLHHAVATTLRLWLAGQDALDRPTAEGEGEEVGRW